MKQLNLIRQIRKVAFQPLISDVILYVFYLKLTVVWGKHNLVLGLLLISMRVKGFQSLTHREQVSVLLPQEDFPNICSLH